jgi:hypothetical protein
MMSMIMLQPTDDQIARARARDADMQAKLIEKYGKEHLDNSISEGEGTLIGLLGEEIVYDRYPGVFERSTGTDIYDFDLVDKRVVGKVDVKTKICTSAPLPYYWCTVCAANTEQLCDYYCFVRVLEDLSRAWIMGFLPKADFFKGALFFHKGDTDPTSESGWQFRWDCYNVAVSRLWSPPTSPETITLQEMRWTPKR